MADRAHEVADAIVDGLDNASKTPPIFNAAWLREAIAAAIMAEREAARREENEACAARMDALAQWSLDAAQKTIDEWVNVPDITAEDRASNRQMAAEYRAQAPVFRSAASAIRSAPHPPGETP